MEDMKAADKSKDYVVNMAVWHRKLWYREVKAKDGPCHVCFAGSVIAASIGGLPDGDLRPSDYTLLVRRRLYALDSIRKGLVGAAFEDLKITDKPPYPRAMIPVTDDIDELAKVFMALARELDEVIIPNFGQE